MAYETPSAADGQGSVSVSCSPASGSTFPIGTTPVTCTATDSLNRTGTCSFNVTVSKILQLSKTRFLAFGDSITEGEIWVSAGSGLAARGSVVPQVVVPSTAYPTVLGRLLQSRYPTQSNSITVFNYGRTGEKAVNARVRFTSALNAVRPDVVLLMEGVNDIAGGEDRAASGAASAISSMAAEARVQGIRVFIATPTPGLAGGTQAIDPVLLVDYANRMKDVAAREGAVLVDLYALMLPDAQRYFGVDGLHPIAPGYARIAELFSLAIQNALEVR